MVETLDSSEKARGELMQKVGILRRQSVLGLSLAVISLLITVYLYYQLEQSRAALETKNVELIASDKQIEKKNYEILALNKELDTFRQQYIKENPSMVANRLPNLYTKQSKSHDEKVTIQPDSRKALVGYIVYIHDRLGSRVSESLQLALKEQGAIVPAIEHISDRVQFGNAVKYFNKQDKAIAYFIQGIILKTIGSKIEAEAKKLPVNYLDNDEVALGQLEVWINL